MHAAATWPPTVVRMLSRRGAPGRPARNLGAALAAVAAVAAGSACADTADGPLATENPVVTEAATTTSVAPPPPRSSGTVEIGDTRYQFAVTCQDLGAGEVVVIGASDDPVSGGLVELYLQVFLGDPYVGLRLADGTLIEPSLDSQLDLYLQDDVIRASAIRFVRDLNLETGEATEVGFGEFEIHCYSYERELPS